MGNVCVFGNVIYVNLYDISPFSKTLKNGRAI